MLSYSNEVRDEVLASIAANQKLHMEWQKQNDERQAAWDTSQLAIQATQAVIQERKI